MTDSTVPTASRFWPARVVEWGLSLCVIAGIVWVAASFVKTGYLPQPFIYDTNDTFMDWFNTAYWTHHSGAYSVWRTVYPPLSFAFLKLTTIGACYRDSPFWARDCDWLSKAWIMGFFVLNLLLVARSYRADDPATAPPRTIAMAIGLPMLFALERGNLILPCFTAFALAYGRLLKQAWIQWTAVALTVNFKPYLILAIAPYLVRRRWRWLEGCAFAILGVYLIAYVATGAGTPMELYDNTRNWVQVVGAMFWGDIFYSTSFATLSAAMKEPIPLLIYLDSKIVDLVATGLPVLVHGGQAVVGLVFLASAFRPYVLSHARTGALAMAFILTTQSPGGYSEVFLLFLVFFERAAGPARITALVCAYLLCIPFDYILVTISQGISHSWLSHRSVYFTFGLSVGQFVRPALILLIEYSLAFASLVTLFGGVARAPTAASVMAPALQ
jgi:hypothetical protein